MRAGGLKRIVQVQSQSTAKDEFGTREDTWATVKTLRASIEPVSAKEQFARSGEHSDITHRVRLRYDPTFTLSAEHRLVHEGVVFDIAGPPINTFMKNRELICQCIERSRDS